jgi:hypothetical protein
VKTQLMPDFDFDAFNHDDVEGMEGEIDEVAAEVEIPNTDTAPSASSSSSTEEVDKW